MDATSMASVWTLVALVIFLGIVLYVKVPGMVGKSLDDRADKIRNQLEEARKLREEAQQLLAEYQRKRKEAEKEADEMISAARHEAEAIIADARRKTGDYVARRTALAEQKIARAEREAVNEVRSDAVEIAVAAAGKLLEDRMDGKAAASLFKSSLPEVKSRLN